MDALPPGIDLSQVPLAANPNGDPPNFVNPPSLISTVQAVGITLGLISLVLVILRLTVYHRTKRGVGFDDVFVVMAFLLAAGYTGISCSLKDVTRHAWDTPISFLDVAYLKKLFVTSLFYGPMLFFAKASILLLYYRAFRPIKWLRISIYVILFILFCSYIVTVL
ncbi:hypothetical protein F4813DRAFT_64600 [Daldinia decipiens]|uniref:uncharacterized protein n=1 Tax=Daldinia decipiens TaxID=326647 RepID=UPI0020C3537C|nr:uncharacterized protein F4813DRAFT_64600 [Daldinia decipiens]KAI1657939.1 hypothetical protein F4813DRAFT_64600 [Daldinia decipiens]